MSKRPSAIEIDDEAAAWAIRLDGRDLEAAPPELEAWLSEDARRAGALLRAQAALSLIDRTRALPPALRAKPLPRRAFLVGGAAAAAAGAAFFLPALNADRRYRAAVGEVRRVPLQDGSLAVINTATAMEVVMERRRRKVLLTSGEAWFEVAKDKSRPFVVAAGDIRVQAVGTAFSVRRVGDGAVVMVTEGVVETWTEGPNARKVRIVAGSKATILRGLAPEPVAAAADIERGLAWRNGQIALDGETLADAAAEFNRYNDRQIVIEDPELARQRFVGLFQTNAPDAFARAVAQTVGATVDEDAATIRLKRPGVS